MTAFFIPEVDAGAADDAYTGIRKAAQRETGHAPLEDQIFKLWCRREGVDSECEVGKPDPVCGETVLAILDLGRHFPYLVHCASPGGRTRSFMIEKPVYAVTEFGTHE